MEAREEEQEMTKIHERVIALVDAEDTGAELRKMREAAGLNQAQLGVYLGVHPSTIQRWENGKAQPSIGEARRIAQILEAGGPIPGLSNRPFELPFHPLIVPRLPDRRRRRQVVAA
jgi:transcriptional regulator with XRE-family HTH domain